MQGLYTLNSKIRRQWRTWCRRLSATSWRCWWPRRSHQRTFGKCGLAIRTEVESGWAAVTAVRRQFVAIYSNCSCITSQVTSMSSFPVMKIKMSPVANEISIKWILWTRFHHFLETLTLSWLQVDSNCLLNRRIHVFLAQFLLKMRPTRKVGRGMMKSSTLPKKLAHLG